MGSMAASSDRTYTELNSIRDTVESIWVAIVLAFVLRAFVIEAFVIPTGSMAPRLMGEHWQLTCPACGYEYAYGVPEDMRRRQDAFRRAKETPTGARCPNCAFEFPYTSLPDYIHNGDRVLVMKYLYRFSPPQPWDVVVFKNPQNNRENYIKRLIGLPGETLQIVHGDIFVQPGPDQPYQIRRKPAKTQEAMWQVVFDNDYSPDRTLPHWGRLPAPRWKPSEPWDLSQDFGRRMEFRGSAAPAAVTLEAQRAHFVPNYGYNPAGTQAENPTDICTDLQLSAMFTPRSSDSVLSMEMACFEYTFRGAVSSQGWASLSYKGPGSGGQWVELERREVSLPAGQGVAVTMENVDLALSLRVGDQCLLRVEDRYPETFESMLGRMEGASLRAIPQPQIAVTAQGGPCSLSHVRLYRDVYYTTPPLHPADNRVLGQYAQGLGIRAGERGWGTTGNPITLRKDASNSDLDEFFVLGDNSPKSLDSRCWTSASPTLQLYDGQDQPLYKLGTVPRYNMIGKAFFVYWPAGFHVPGLPALPIVPNVGKMRLIR